mmetsp:Transcript_12244/g.24168  ORF Transcript_12244/g.24168 Transcript_12244/m.24168 type:complete len:261 (+) Transcript_12244:1884-2666(+)
MATLDTSPTYRNCMNARSDPTDVLGTRITPSGAAEGLASVSRRMALLVTRMHRCEGTLVPSSSSKEQSVSSDLSIIVCMKSSCPICLVSAPAGRSVDPVATVAGAGSAGRAVSSPSLSLVMLSWISCALAAASSGRDLRVMASRWACSLILLSMSSCALAAWRARACSWRVLLAAYSLSAFSLAACAATACSSTCSGVGMVNSAAGIESMGRSTRSVPLRRLRASTRCARDSRPKFLATSPGASDRGGWDTELSAVGGAM